MRILVRSSALVLFVLSIAGCSPQERLDDQPVGGSQVYYSPAGQVFAIGARSRYESDEFMRAEAMGTPLPYWREFLRLGKWEFRYPNGNTKAHIRYELGSYTECCFGGLCKHPYELRTGAFEAWWPDGSRLARGSFAFEWHSVSTNCAGGDRVKMAKLDPDAQFWDQKGNPADASILQIAGVPLEEL